MKRWLAPLRITLGLVLLVLVLWQPETRRGLATIARSPWIPIVAAGTFLSAGLESLRLRLLFAPQGLNLALPWSFRVNLVSHFFNLFIPGGTGGDFVRFYYLSGDYRGRRVEVATLVLLDRVTALFSMLLATLMLATWNGELLARFAVMRWMAAIALTGALGIASTFVLVMTLGEERHARMRDWMSRWPGGATCARLLTVLATYRDHKRVLLAAVGLALLTQAAPLTLFLGLGRELASAEAPTTILFVALLGFLANALPLTPGGIGVGETAFGRLFDLLGYSGGASLMLAWRAALLPLCLAGCLVYLLGLRRRVA